MKTALDVFKNTYFNNSDIPSKKQSAWPNHTNTSKEKVQTVCKYFFSYFRIFLFRYQIFKSDFFFVINFSYFVIGFLLNSSVVKDNEIGKVNGKKNLIKKSDNEIGKF